MHIVNIHAAKTNLSRLVDEAAGGEEIVIARAGKPVARLVALESASEGRRRLGGLAHLGPIPNDFDRPLPNDLLDAFEGR
ncbi:MAG TPA: type II toxin-antitoxin system prevent-host-death family antitoxin [Caulobacteraceae bacterium]|jgi:prevent-host-death family protein|nr:type II toxin-antitoxin system prevent-host-death family antitoxin [Caulobacteraceae bacterium]